MIIPIRCFTCGKVLADKWEHYSKKRQDGEKIDYKNLENTSQKKLFEELGIEKICCRRHLLSHIDLIEKI